jgi:hypothetical protein
MLKEILGVADDPPARRRWFHDEFFDLFVWQQDDSSDRALVWDKGRGFFHDGPPAPDDVVARFDDAAAALPQDIAAEIREKIHEFAGRRLVVTSRRKQFRRAAWQR